MADMSREEAAREIDNTACCFSDKRFRDAMHMAADALRGWVKTADRLPTEADAGIDGMVAFCYRDNWDCFNRLEKWSDISPQKYTYWHRMLKAPRSEE
jgi:hypothetical protein